jgi:hypothetical protein
MDILTEIIETSDNMVDVLNEDGFFEEHALIHPSDLRVALQIKMQRKWEQENNMYLNDTEFLEVCNELITESVSNGLSDLIASGHVEIAVNPNGEIVYSTTDKPFEL